MSQGHEPRPELSYVVAAMTADEVHNAARWLREHPVSPKVEIVLAAPGSILARVAARVIPPGVRIASAEPPIDRKAVRVAGARATTGLVVIVVDCDDDLDAKLRDPFAVGEQAPVIVEDPLAWVGELEPGNRPMSFLSRSGQIAPAAH